MLLQERLSQKSNTLLHPTSLEKAHYKPIIQEKGNKTTCISTQEEYSKTCMGKIMQKPRMLE